MNSDKNFNARCPNCGEEFTIETSSSLNVLCPNCGEECSVVQAKKYFSTIHATKEEYKEAHGVDYQREMLILDEVYGYIGLGDYENAEKKVYEALELTDSDYRVFMAMVAVKTHNYTDLSDETHKEYVNKAIALADSDGKKEIKQIYRPYYLKRQLTEGELAEYHKEEKDLRRKKLEEGLKNQLPAFDLKQKRQKLFAILFPVLFAVGIALSVGLYFSSNQTLMVIGLPFIVAGYVLFRMWFLARDNIVSFNALLDLFDMLDGVQLSASDDKLSSVYKNMQKLCERFADGDSPTSMSTDISSLLDSLIELNDENINSFLLKNKFFSQYVSDED